MLLLLPNRPNRQCFRTFDMAPPRSSDGGGGERRADSFSLLLFPSISFPFLTLTFLGNLMPNLATKGRIAVTAAEITNGLFEPTDFAETAMK